MLEHDNGSGDIGSTFVVRQASQVVHTSSPLMAMVNRHEHWGRVSGRRVGLLAGDSSLTVHGEGQCEGDRAPCRRCGGRHLEMSRYDGNPSEKGRV